MMHQCVAPTVMSKPLTWFRTSRTDSSRETGGRRPLTLGGAAAVALSVLASGLGYFALPAQLRIHWTLGLGPYYGPEFAPKPLVLIGAPLLVGAVALGLRALDSYFTRDEEYAQFRPLFVALSVGTLAVLVTVQMFLILANL